MLTKITKHRIPVVAMKETSLLLTKEAKFQSIQQHIFTNESDETFTIICFQEACEGTKEERAFMFIPTGEIFFDEHLIPIPGATLYGIYYIHEYHLCEKI
jgi:hypothetical protein